MMLSRAKLLARAENAKRESKHVEFKSDFDPTSSGMWCELLKDMVAFANSGGGAIVFGLKNDGFPSSMNKEAILAIDLADIANKIRRYTDHEFSDIEIVEIERGGIRLAAFLVSGSNVPMIFTKPGTYETEPAKQKTAFSQGTIYFRHGAKSEPGHREDLVRWLDREIERVRKNWIGGIRKVVEAPAGHVINVVSSPTDFTTDSPAKGLAVTAQISADPGSVRVVPQNAEGIWPYRQKELLKKVNKQIHPARINGHDIICINGEFDVLGSHPEFAYKPHKLASPQYSDQFVAWLVNQYKTDPRFFTRMRENRRNRIADKL
jgi:hypothetical protein